MTWPFTFILGPQIQEGAQIVRWETRPAVNFPVDFMTRSTGYNLRPFNRVGWRSG